MFRGLLLFVCLFVVPRCFHVCFACLLVLASFVVYALCFVVVLFVVFACVLLCVF